MQPCLWTDMFDDLEPEEAVRICGEAGFRLVEFGCSHEAKYLEGNEREGERLAGIKQAAEKAGVQILQMHGRLFNLCGADAEANIAWAHRSIRRAAELGVRWVVLHPGSSENYGADVEEMEWVRARNVEVFRSFAKTAAEVGVGIAIENMSMKKHRFGAMVGDLLWLLEQLAGSRVGICWDTGHAQLSQLNQAVAVKTLGSRLVALHIDDNDGLSDKHWTPLRGSVKWPEFMSALRSIGFTGPFNLEVPGERNVTPLPARPAKARYLYELCRYMLSPAFGA
ncbi:MAG TPA: sugar phosphate isomerase/epimerase [Firmicutes bacterium]|nr:sugar phosphate isomerase/epimerase [Bacillota bacterium]